MQHVLHTYYHAVQQETVTSGLYNSSLLGAVGNSSAQLRGGTGNPSQKFHKRFNSMMKILLSLNGRLIQLFSTIMYVSQTSVHSALTSCQIVICSRDFRGGGEYDCDSDCSAADDGIGDGFHCLDGAVVTASVGSIELPTSSLNCLAASILWLSRPKVLISATNSVRLR